MAHPTLLLPAMPGPCPLVAPYTGCLTIPVPARPARPPSPAMCVCVQCAVPVASASIGSAVGCWSVAFAFGRFCFRSWHSDAPTTPLLILHIARTSRKSHAPFAPPCHSYYTLDSSHTPHLPHTTPDITPPTPRTLHTHHIHTTLHLLTTHNHPHHPHHHRLVLAHASLRWHTIYSVPRMHFVLDQVQTMYPKLEHSSQVELSYTKSYPHKYTYKYKHKDAHKYAA